MVSGREGCLKDVLENSDPRSYRSGIILTLTQYLIIILYLALEMQQGIHLSWQRLLEKGEDRQM